MLYLPRERATKVWSIPFRVSIREGGGAICYHAAFIAVALPSTLFLHGSSSSSASAAAAAAAAAAASVLWDREGGGEERAASIPLSLV